jgi:hypothetical protein
MLADSVEDDASDWLPPLRTVKSKTPSSNTANSGIDATTQVRRGCLDALIYLSFFVFVCFRQIAIRPTKS